MEHKSSNLFRRAWAMLLCVAMLASYVVLPASATETGTTAEDTPKLTLSVDNVNSYEADETVLISGGSLESLAGSEKDVDSTLSTFITNEVLQVQNVDLLPSKYTINNSGGSDGYGVALYSVGEDGSVTITNNHSKGYSYIYTYPNQAVTTYSNIKIYVKYSGPARFNTNLYRAAGPINLARKYATSGDLPAGGSGMEFSFDLLAEMLSDSTITACQFYASNNGGTAGETVVLSEIRIVSSSKPVDVATEKRTGTFMDNYYAIVVDYVGGVGTLSGIDGAEYKVSKVLNCADGSVAEPHKIAAESEKGFVLYVPSTTTTLPEVGDYVNAAFTAGTPTTGTNNLEFYDGDNYTVEEDGSNGLNVDKTVAGEGDDFALTLEAFANGHATTSVSTTPTDIVLVLDQSASMYTPMGATADSYNRLAYQFDLADKAIDPDNLDKEKGKHLGYYVAQAHKPRESSIGNLYDWFIIQYVEGTGWVYARVGDTTTPVKINLSNLHTYDYGDGDQYNNYSEENGEYVTVHSGVQTAGEYDLISGDTYLTYYESQYGALYDSVNSFVGELNATGVDHRIAITGFSSPFYDGIANYNGSGLYIDGKYYLYDTDYKYLGYASSASPTGYLLYVPDETPDNLEDANPYYDSMAGVLPKDLVNITWTTQLPADTELVRLDPNRKNEGTSDDSPIYGTSGKEYKDGHYFAAYPATDPSMTDYEVVTEKYDEALVSVKTDMEGIRASIEEIRTNYMQTCPAAGLDMAQKIFDAYGDDARDKIVVLFTDGVPTVSLQADQDYAESQNAGTREKYYSGLSGVEDAVNMANTLKYERVQIYTIGTSGLDAEAGFDYKNGTADNPYGTPEFKFINGYTFLEYVSSDYRGVTSWHDSWYYNEKGDDNPNDLNTDGTIKTDNTYLGGSVLHFYQDSLDENGEVVKDAEGNVVKVEIEIGGGTPTAEIYAMTADDGDFNFVFSEIVKEEFVSDVTLDGDAVLKDVMSDYFDLSTVNSADIKVYIAPYLGETILGKDLFGEKVSLDDVDEDSEEYGILSSINVELVNADRKSTTGTEVEVKVTGFNYSTYYVRVENGEASGYKIIVEVPITVRPGFWGGNNVPTNKNTTAIYDEDGKEVQKFPEPEVDVELDLSITAEEKTVYYGGYLTYEVPEDGDPIKNELDPTDLFTVTAGGLPVTVTKEEGFKPQADWMDDYADLNWTQKQATDEDGNPSVDEDGNPIMEDASTTLDTNVSNTQYADYPFSVTMTPKETKENGVEAKKDDASGKVNVLVPVYTFEDTTVDLGYTPDCNDENLVSGPEWVDQETGKNLTEVKAENPDYADPDADTKPTLELTYSTSGKIWEETKVNVTVTSKNPDGTTPSGTIQNVVSFQWKDCEDSTNHSSDEDIETHKGNVDSVEFNIHVGSIMKDVVVIDFGLPVKINVLTNDQIVDPKLVGLDKTAGNYGTVSVNTDTGVVTYTIKTMQMVDEDVFTYTVSSGDDTEHTFPGTLTVVPAANIYYEDSFLSFEDSDAANTDDEVKGLGEWIVEVETDADPTQDEDRPGVDTDNLLGALDADNVYGYDSAYGSYKTYSLGSAHKVTVDSATGKNGVAPYATFTFTGTGFDVVGLTDSSSGAIWVEVTKQGETKATKSYIVNTYYGYIYNSTTGEWEITKGDNALYQVPVIKVTDLDYGTYTVKIHAIYMASMDMDYKAELNEGEVNSYTVWLDAIRIYDPAKNDTSSNGFYAQDGEQNPWYTTVKSLLTSPDTITDEKNATGIMFIDGKNGTTSLIDYANQGPNNETYLKNGNGIAFRLLSNATTAPDVTLQIGAKLASGESADLYYGSDKLATIKTATNMFYKLGTLTWEQVQINGVTCWMSNPIVLKCVSATDSILSLTDIKAVGKDAAAISASDSVDPDEETALVAWFDQSIVSDSVSIATKSASLTMKDEVFMNIYFVGNSKLDSIPVENMGLLTWSTDPGTNPNYSAATKNPGASYSAQYDMYWCQTDGIAAKNLGDDIWFCAYAETANGTVYSDVRSYSPKTYALDRIANSSSAEMKALCVAMLNYGAAAQTQFGYKTDDLMNDGINQSLVNAYDASMITSASVTVKDSVKTVTCTESVNATKAGAFGIVNTDENVDTGFSKMTASASFEGAFSINFYFTPNKNVYGRMMLYAWSAEDYKNLDVLTPNNATYTIEMTEKDGVYSASYTDIAARQIDDVIYVCGVYTPDSSRDTYYSTGVIAYSLGCYCVDRIEKSADTNMIALAKATAVYGYYAKQYFG